MPVAQLPAEDFNTKPKRARIEIQQVLGFSDEDKIGTIQLVTLRIRGMM